MSLTQIMQAVHDVQADIVTPVDAAKGLVVPADIQPPPSLGDFPIFVNELAHLQLREGELSGQTFGAAQAVRHNEWLVEMHLCFAAFDPKYIVLQQWLWTDPVLDAFKANPTLNASCDASIVRNVDFRPYDYNGTKYICSTFPLHISATGA